ncbi:MAG: pyridoxamine 5'-phosphate oxidase family protein [Thermoanaerobaculales bacterium]|nr:pyridoxamine 5'-phosphate oxidase family protein [Thermoanaerobaculales bacterium]
MRRRDREIGSRAGIDAVIRAADVCRLAFACGGEPYLVPVSFGYDGQALYFHSAPSGRKLEFIAANPRVCFEVEADVTLLRNDNDACSWSFAYSCVIGYGTVVELASARDKARGLDEIMRHYSGRAWAIPDSQLAATRVWRVEIESLTGKRSPHPDSVGEPPL